MDLFSPYKNTIANALRSNAINKSINESALGQRSMLTFSDFQLRKSSLVISDDLVKIAIGMKAQQFNNQVIGHHPDFIHLKHTNQTEYHNIVSAFIDIKGSTNLFRKYDPETVFIITNTIQLAAISVCEIFGGFIQRLQGDGLFVYFGGKGRDKSLANIHSLTALSFFLYFVENDLKNLFEEQGIEKIKAKVGIDFGEDKDVLWAMAGVADTSEITTISLHTSLASKMQQYAGSNEIVIGQNVVDCANVPNPLINVVESKRYIFQDVEKGLCYTQYKFNWLGFLKKSNYIATSPFDGTLAIKPFERPDISHYDSLPLIPIVADNKPWRC